MAKMWDARFQKAENNRVNDFNSSISFDARMYREDIAGSIAHATMLGKCGIIPESEAEKRIFYTGTHDNTTSLSWWKELPREVEEIVFRYLNIKKCSSGKKMTWNLIALAMSSVSDLCIIPMQDYLCLSNAARINTPSTLGDNWKWRMSAEQLSPELAEEILELCKLYGRVKEK